MKIHLAYGKEGLDVEIPDRNLVKVMTQAGFPPLANPVAELEKQLVRPISSNPLSTLARHAGSACVVISDITRPVPNTVLLPPILRTLEENGIQRRNIEILIATGLHRQSTTDELRSLVGESILQCYAVKDHHARVIAEQRFLGLTARGTPMYVDDSYCRADLKITTGFIEPHLMAGFSGGRKLVAPGCAGEQTIKALHSPAFLEHANCREGCLEGNPLHEELLAIAKAAGHDFIVNVSLNAANEITGIFSGNPAQAHDEGVRHVREGTKANLQNPVDIVVTTSAGYPLDLTYYQAVKGMTAALPIVRTGGTLILAAECAEGLGSEEFTTMATANTSAESFVNGIALNPVVIDQWQLEECAKAARKATVVLVSTGIPDHQKAKLFIRTSPSIEDALASAFMTHGPDATVAVIPKGPYTLVEIG